MKKSKITTALVWILTIFTCLIILWPVYWIVKSSFTQADKLYQMPIEYLPINLTLDSYSTLFTAKDFTKYVSDTLIVTVSTLVVSVFFCALAAYGFSRNKSKGLNAAFGFLLFSTMIPGTVTVLPLMQMWRGLGLTDSYSGTVILYVSLVIPFSTIMYSTYIRQIPSSLEEAAMIDGTTMLGAFFRIIFPLLKPIIATLGIINFISCINEFFTPLMFTSKNVKMLSTMMNTVPRVNQYQLPWDTISAAGCLMLLPVIIFVTLFEKNIMEGLMLGSIKQ